MNMTCDAWRGAILEHAAGDLAPHRMAAVERHLVECPACRAESAAWRLLADEARLAVRLAAPPVARAMGKVRAVAAAEASSRPLLPLTVRPGWSRKPWWPGVLAMAACAAGLYWMAGSPVAPTPVAPTSPRRSADAPAVGATAADATAVGATAQTDPAQGALQGVRPAGNATPAMGRRQASGSMGAAPPAPAAVAAVAPLPPTKALQPAVSAFDPAAPTQDLPMPWVDEERARPDRRTATPWPPAQPEPSAWPIGPSATSPAPATTAQPTRPRLARIAGRVEDPDGQPVPMALVYLRPAQSGEGWGVVLTDTDGNGRFSLDLPPGRWELWVEAAGLPPWRYQDEPVLDLGGQAERGGILVRLPESPPPPSLPTASPSLPQPTGTSPAAAPIRIAPILPPAAPTSQLPDPIEPKEWMP